LEKFIGNSNNISQIFMLTSLYEF